MLQKDTLARYLSLCMNSEADFAEIFEEEEISETISSLNQAVESVNRRLKSGAGIRLYRGVQSVYGYTNHTDDAHLLPMIDDLRAAISRADLPEDGPAPVTLLPVDVASERF